MPIPETEEEVLQWLPEIDAVKGDLRDVTLEIFTDHVPDYLWVVRASERYHPPDHRGQHGLMIHIKRSFNAWLRIERMLKELSLIDSFEANCGRAAILCHDSFKYGKSEWKDDDVMFHQYVDQEYWDLMIGVPKFSDKEHGSVAAEYVDEHFDVPDEVVRCVHTHNGGFSDDPNPDDILELGHHLADAFASGQRLNRIYDFDGIYTDYVMSPPPVIGNWEYDNDLEPFEEL